MMTGQKNRQLVTRICTLFTILNRLFDVGNIKQKYYRAITSYLIKFTRLFLTTDTDLIL